jgi:hypothetical protein
MGTDKTTFAEDPEDLTIAHAWPEVTSPEVTWLFPYFFPVFPHIFPPYFFPLLYIKNVN